MDALKTLSDKIRALAAAEPALAKDRGGRAEIARRTGASPQLVRQALGSAQPRTTRHPDPTTVRPMDGAEFSACIARIGITAPWLARLLGIHPARVRARAAGTTAVTLTRRSPSWPFHCRQP